MVKERAEVSEMSPNMIQKVEKGIPIAFICNVFY